VSAPVSTCWIWPVGETGHEQAYFAATAERETERARIRENLMRAWHADRCDVKSAAVSTAE
jgi:hypothetical protein